MRQGVRSSKFSDFAREAGKRAAWPPGPLPTGPRPATEPAHSPPPTTDGVVVSSEDVETSAAPADAGGADARRPACRRSPRIPEFPVHSITGC